MIEIDKVYAMRRAIQTGDDRCPFVPKGTLVKVVRLEPGGAVVEMTDGPNPIRFPVVESDLLPEGG
jgi:hypothetical protein